MIPGESACESARPQSLSHALARVLDALQEDVDTMLMELGSWAEELNKNTVLLHHDKRVIDSDVNLLSARLQRLDQGIAEEMERIAASKAAIHKHETRMRRAIALVVEKMCDK